MLCLIPTMAVADTQFTRTDAVLELTVAPDAPPEGVRWGSEVRYEFHLANTGSLPVTQIAVSDTLCGDVGTVTTLNPGQKTVLYATCVITGTGAGQTTVTGLDPDSLEVVATADHMVEVYIAHDWLDYSVSKRTGFNHAAPGDVVTFVVTIRNVSDEGGEPEELELVDTFDPSLASVDSASGGVVGNGKIVWRLDGFAAEDGPRTVEYRLRISDTAPSGRTLRNVAKLGVVGERNDIAPQDNVSSASISIVPTAEEYLPFSPESETPVSDASDSGGSDSPGDQVSATDGSFLPFTGMPLVAALIALICTSVGALLRIVSHRI